MEEEDVLNEFRVRGEVLHNALDKVDAHVSDLNEYLESVKGKLKERFRELESKEVELKDQSFAVEERAKVVGEAEAKLADLEMKSDGFRMDVEEKKKELNFLTEQVEISEERLSQLRIWVEECEAEKMFKESQLSEMVESWRKTHVELGLKGEELAKMETDLEKCCDDVSAEMEVLRRTQTHRRELDEEAERKTKDLTLVQNKLAECEKLIEISSSELFKTQDELECKREQLGHMEVDLERHHVKASAEMESFCGTQTHMRQLVEEVEKKTKDLTLVQTKLVECEKLLEVRLSRLRTLVEECEAERMLKESQLTEMVESWRKTHVELGLKGEELAKMETDLQKCRDDVSAEIEVLRRTQTHRRQLDEEVERNTKNLTLVQNKLVECKKLLETSSSELIKTQGELECKREQLGEMEADFQWHHLKVSAEKELCERTQIHRRQLDEEVERKTKDLTLVQDKLAECEKLTEINSSELFKTQDELECKREQLGHMESELERHRVKVSTEKEHWERTHAQSRELEDEISRKKKDLTAVLDKIEDCGIQLESVITQLDSKHKLLETRSFELVSKEKELEVISQRIELREQTVISLNSELENVQKLIEERNAQCESLKLLIEKHNEQLASAEIATGVSALPPVNSVLSLDVKLEEPISNSVVSRCFLDVQQDITSSHLPNEEDAPLRNIEDSTSLSPNEISTELGMFKDPGRFILTSVEQALTDASERGELSLEEPILMPLVHLLEELARVGISTDPDLQSDATKVVDRWVEMMGASVEKSPLEAWAVLQFIVAFGLVKGTKQDQTLQLASYVAHFKHAPKLLESLCLTHAIPNFVTQLFGKGLHIPAIRFMFYFKVENNFSPLELLKEQIINLSRSAKEKRRYESQAEEANRDASTLRKMMELIEDFHLEIDIPADLILKFMGPTFSVPVQSTHMQASDTVLQSSYIATHGSTPSFPTSSHHAGSKRPSPRVVDPEGTRPVIRPCFNPPPDFRRF